MNNIIGIDLPSLINLRIGDESFDGATSFSIGKLPSLETLEIGNGCFKSIAGDVSISSFPELITLKIGSNSFYDETNSETINYKFQVYNCSKLELIEIGEHSFSNYGKDFSLSTLPSLQNLTIGSIENESNNFMHVSAFSISGINNII